MGEWSIRSAWRVPCGHTSQIVDPARENVRMRTMFLSEFHPAVTLRSKTPTTQPTMATHLLCLTASGGVPVFTRSIGNVKQLPFPVVGSLNGVHMFCKNREIELQSCLTEDSKVVWKDYKESLSFILVTKDDSTSDAYLMRFLDIVTHCLVLLYGQDELCNIKNVERFKRDIKVCYSLLDHLLESLDTSSSFSCTTAAVDVILGPENNVLQTYLEAFVSAASSPFGFLIINGRVAVATNKWWSMEALERIVLVTFVNSLSRHSSRDLPIFLPLTSPNVPHRLLTFELVTRVEVCVICGPTPTLAQLQPEVERFWRTSMDSLRSLSRLTPRNCPSTITFDKNLMGFLLENTESHRCLSSVQLTESTDTEKMLNRNRRKELLASYYKQTVSTLWLPQKLTATQSHEAEPPGLLNESERLCHLATDSYSCADSHKCYALLSPPYRLFALFTTDIPTFAMRSVTNKTLQLLLKDKNIVL